MGGHKGRPYDRAPGFLVGAGFIPARAAERLAETLRETGVPYCQKNATHP